MARRQRSETRRLSAPPVGVRLAPATRAAVAAAAALEGLSDAAWLRARAVEAAGAPPEEALPTEPVEPVFLPSETLEAVGQLAARVSRLNGAVVQLARTWREAVAAELHADAEAVLADLRSTQAELGRIAARIRAAEEARC